MKNSRPLPLINMKNSRPLPLINMKNSRPLINMKNSRGQGVAVRGEARAGAWMPVPVFASCSSPRQPGPLSASEHGDGNYRRSTINKIYATRRTG